MTQAAVSYQIRLLEERLGTSLFLRGPRGIALTDTGQWLAPHTIEAFNLLRETYDRFEGRQQETLIINTTHGFAALWLAPRLGNFHLAYPGIAVRLETTDRVVDFAREDSDVVIRAGGGKWPGLTAIKVQQVRYTPMLSPDLAASIGGIHGPADIIKLPLLDTQYGWWATWLAANDLPLAALEGQSPRLVGMQAVNAGAAMDGLGVALLSPAYFRRELAEGRLIRPLEGTLEADWSYWLAYPESRRNLRKIKVFRDWVLAEAGQDVE